MPCSGERAADQDSGDDREAAGSRRRRSARRKHAASSAHLLVARQPAMRMQDFDAGDCQRCKRSRLKSRRTTRQNKGRTASAPNGRSEPRSSGRVEERFVGGIGDDVFLHDQLDAVARKMRIPGGRLIEKLEERHRGNQQQRDDLLSMPHMPPSLFSLFLNPLSNNSPGRRQGCICWGRRGAECRRRFALDVGVAPGHALDPEKDNQQG